MDEILELTQPKVEALSFKVSEDDKKMILQFCEDREFRLSAFLRVSVLKNIKEFEKED